MMKTKTAQGHDKKTMTVMMTMITKMTTMATMKMRMVMVMVMTMVVAMPTATFRINDDECDEKQEYVFHHVVHTKYDRTKVFVGDSHLKRAFIL